MKAFPVVPFNDTIFNVYTKVGSFTASERSKAIGRKIHNILDLGKFNSDSLKLLNSESSIDIIYNSDNLLMTVTESDALFHGVSKDSLAISYKYKIEKELQAEQEAYSLMNILKRIAYLLLVICGFVIVIYLINRIFRKLTQWLNTNQERFFQGFNLRSVKILTAQKQLDVILKLVQFLKWIVIIIAVYLSLPIIFSIFPETKSFTNTLLSWILDPAKSALLGIWYFLPNLFTIIVIFLITRYAIKGLKFLVDEISKGNLNLPGFHPDFASPTFNIVKFLLYAFMVVLMFPYLPGSDSSAFQGVSVFVGVLFSLGSSSAISNMIAGLVITYMRPFQIGDRIKIGDLVGDVVEKTMLVVRIRTIKNEDITIPNSSVLSNSTLNFSANARQDGSGLIIHTTVTIGYDVPWKNMHKALIEAAVRTELILKDPKPFVLQTSLDDFYVSYQINAYTKEANQQAVIYSNLHQNIQDACNENGIEILSPHYRAARDGNMITIPADYLPKDYESPSFNFQIKDQKKRN